jgi:hypothetical protein
MAIRKKRRQRAASGEIERWDRTCAETHDSQRQNLPKLKWIEAADDAKSGEVEGRERAGVDGWKNPKLIDVVEIKIIRARTALGL